MESHAMCTPRVGAPHAMQGGAQACPGILSGIEPERLCDDIENVLSEYLCDGLDELERVLGGDDAVFLDSDAISKMVDRAMYAFQQPVREHMAHMRQYAMKHVFEVSGLAMRVYEHDAEAAAQLQSEHHGAPISAEEAQLDEELRAIRAAISAKTRAASAHRQQKARVEAQKEQCAAYLRALGAVGQTHDEEAVRDSVRQVLQSVVELRQLADSVSAGLQQCEQAARERATSRGADATAADTDAAGALESDAGASTAARHALAEDKMLCTTEGDMFKLANSLA